MNFDGFRYILDKQKSAFRVEGVAKFKVSHNRLPSAYANLLLKYFGSGWATSSGCHWNWDAVSKAHVLKLIFVEGSESDDYSPHPL